MQMLKQTQSSPSLPLLCKLQNTKQRQKKQQIFSTKKSSLVKIPKSDCLGDTAFKVWNFTVQANL